MAKADEAGDITEDQRLAVAAGQLGIVPVLLHDPTQRVLHAIVAKHAGVETDGDLERVVLVPCDLEKGAEHVPRPLAASPGIDGKPVDAGPQRSANLQVGGFCKA